MNIGSTILYGYFDKEPGWYQSISQELGGNHPFI